MAQEPNLFGALSDVLVARFATARDSLAVLRISERARLGAIIWRQDVRVTSEQSLPRRDALEAVLADGATVPGRLVGRDPSTNVAVIRFDRAVEAATLSASVPQVGALVVAA